MDRQLKQAALQVPGRLRGPAFGGITFRPASDVASRCGVCRAGERAAYASEPVPARAIAAVDATALGASLTGIFRIDADQRHAMQRRLVAHETPKLGKCPTMVRTCRAQQDLDEDWPDYVPEAKAAIAAIAAAMLETPEPAGHTSSELGHG